MENPFSQVHAVFVYGTLKAGYPNHDLLTGGSSYLGTAITKEPKWAMISFRGFPAVIPGKENFIMGELYLCDTMTLDELDVLEGNGSLYERREIEVTLTEDDTTWTAWVYTLCPFRLTESDDPDKFEQPGVVQYQFADDVEIPVDCWEPPAVEIGRPQPIEFTRIVDDVRAVVHYVDDAGEVLTTISTSRYREPRSRSRVFTTASTLPPAGMVADDVALAQREAENRIRDARTYASLKDIDANRKQWAEAVLASLKAAGEDAEEILDNEEESIDIDVSSFAEEDEHLTACSSMADERPIGPHVLVRETVFVRDTR